MRTNLTKSFCSVVFVLYSILSIGQETLKSEFRIGSSDDLISTCDCNTISPEDFLSIRVFLTPNIFEYDLVSFSYRNDEHLDLILDSDFQGSVMRAEYQTKGYIDLNIYDIKVTDLCNKKIDVYKLHVNVAGYMITGYSERVVGNTIETTPVYNSGTFLGNTDEISIDTDAGEAAKKRRRMILGGCAAVLVATAFIVLF